MGNKGCWTCRARKVKCDLSQPVCGNCIKARQPCQGYGIQLSWPREGDNRRSWVYHGTGTLESALRHHRKSDAVFLNATHWDVSLSHALLERRDIGRYLHPLKVPHLPYLPSSSHLDGNDALLLDFFNQSKSQILAPIIDEALAQFILRVALSDSSCPSNLVLEGVFTIASLQLQGVSKSRTRQNRLISMLRENITQDDKENVLRNLIATMLLYQYEVYMTTSPKKWWSFYLCGAKKIIDASATVVEFYNDESAILMDWIYYHEVMSEFSLRHWAEASAIDNFCKGALAVRPKGAVVDESENASGITCPIDALDLIRIICKRPSANRDDFVLYDDTEIERIWDLKQSLQESVGEHGTFHDISEASLTRQQMLAYLYRCAALIYLNREVLKVSPTSFQHRRLVREGILLLRHLGFCESAWPMLILACEASEDEQRLQILATISETGREPLHRSNHVPLIQRMIETIWNQNDLLYGTDVDYFRTLYAVISTAPVLPLFA